MNANKFELRPCPEKGQGVFATASFSAGDTVMTGIVIKVLRSNHSHASQIGENQFVQHGGLISKVNHSCNPNCGIRVNDVGGHDFVAMKDGCANEEITFDYAMRNYTIDHFPDECMCGASNCRGSVTGWKDLSDSKKDEYKDFAAPYLFDLDTKVKKRKKAQANEYRTH